MHKRAEGGGGTVARPDNKMGNMRDEPYWGTGKRKRPISSAIRKVLKRSAAKKRRQRSKIEKPTYAEGWNPKT